METVVDLPDRKYLATVGVLVYLSGLGPASFHVFIPAVDRLQADFHATPSVANLTISLSLTSFAIASLVFGAVADRFGRRKVVIFGMLTLIVGSLICARATSIGAVILGRVVQPAGGAAGIVGARIIVVDLFKSEKAGNAMSKLAAAMMIAPLVGVPVGGWLTDHFGWRSNFYFILSLATLGLILALSTLPELADNQVHRHDKRQILIGYKEILKNSAFWRNTLQFGFSLSAFMTFMSAAPIVFAKTYGLSVSMVSLALVCVSGSAVAGNFLSSSALAGVSLERRFVGGSVVGGIAGVVGMGLCFMNFASVAPLLVPAMAWALSYGVSGPAAQFGSMNAIPKYSGTATGLSMFLGMQLASLSTQVTALLNDGTPIVVGTSLAILSLLALGALKVHE